MMRLNSIISFIALFAFVMGIAAQEVEKPLKFSVEQYQQSQLEKSNSQRAGGGTIPLPFFDDFSVYSLPTTDPEIPVECQRWEDDYARINTTLAILPPTYGVATLDGLDETGFPYEFSEDSYGEADVLTSLPMNLSAFDENSNVYLHFRYQAGGRGNPPNTDDSLVVDFLAPQAGDDAWFRQWAIEGTEQLVGDDFFTSVFIPINEPIFLQDGFKFRFRNYATLSGNLDLWHLDYVFLDANIDPETFNVVEVAFSEPVNTLLNEYTAMPWSHFVSNASIFMEDEVSSISRNLSATQADNIQSGFKVEYPETAQIWDFENPFQTVIVNPLETFEVPYFVNDGVNENFVYDTTVNDTCAVFNVTFYEDAIGIGSDDKVGILDNDSIQFEQVFTNYYAYDDGSAESAYALDNAAGGKVAMRYNVVQPDTLLGLFIHFTPFNLDNSNETFLMRAWTNDGGQPGEEIGENFQFKSPVYYMNGYDVFGYYEYDDPLAVEGTIFVGVIQNKAVNMNFGMDKNTNQNTSKLYYQLGLGAGWQQSGIQGTVMIRPVFKSGKTDVWNSIEEIELDAARVYPNPMNDALNISQLPFGNYSIELYNQMGQLAHSSQHRESNISINLADLSVGMYLLQIINEAGIREQRKLLKQ